jgi:TolB-like protein/Tfp pilus assembly protein PilF
MGITGATLLALYAAGVKDRTLDTVQGDSISSLAVLPLENLSRDPAQDYFADGMTDELITTLAKLQSVKVISRSSVVRYKGTTRSLADIARELKVDGIIEGTVLHSGNRVRITVQLVRAAVDQHIWAETYDGNVQDVIKLQDAIARAVAAEIRVKLNPTQQARMNNSKSVDPAAYEAYLRGRYLSYSRWSKESDAAAAHYYEEAMAKDPGYAPAYSGLADYYTFKGFEQRTDRADAVKAKDLAAQALKLDAGLADGHIAMANALYRIDWNWAEADKEFRKGIELNPDAPNSYFCYALYLGVLGRHEEAIAAMRRAIELDPFSATMNTGLGIVLQWSGQNEQAVMQARKAIALDPLLADAHSVLARADEQLGRYDEAIAEYSESDRLSGIDPSTVADFKRIYMNSGINGYRRKKLDWEMQRIGSGEANYFNMAKLAADLGEKDVAFQWLEKTFQQHDVVIVNIKVASSLRSLHGDSRFSDLVRRVGLP